MVCTLVRRDFPRALAQGLSTVQVHAPCSILLVPNIQGRPCPLRSISCQNKVSVNCGTNPDKEKYQIIWAFSFQDNAC